MSGLPREGDLYGRFQIRRVLGRGSMGAVFEAYDPTLRRLVALKVVLPDMADMADMADLRERFDREAQLLARVRSSHIVHIHDVGRQDDSLYVVTDLVPDGDLSSWLADRGAMAPADALRLVAQLCDGLADAHKEGIVHRDLKPRNVLLWNRDGSLIGYLCDFGIAVDQAPGLTRTGTMRGSPEYLAPERHLGEPATARGDLYSMGCVLWACLTGAPPFSGTESQVINAHLYQSLPTLRLPGGAAREIARLLDRLLEKDPDRRPSSATEVSQEALRVANALDRGHRPEPGFLTANFESSYATTAADPSRMRPDRRVLVMVGVVAVALIAIALGGYAIASGGSDADKPSASTEPSDSPSETAAAPDPTATAGVVGGTQTASAFTCWDGAEVGSADECKPPHGTRAFYWIFPGMAGQNCRPRTADNTPGRAELMECYLKDRRVQIHLSLWDRADAGISHYTRQEALGQPQVITDANGIPTLYGWNGAGQDPAYPYEGVLLWPTHAYSAAIYVASNAELASVLEDPTLLRPVPDDQYLGTPSG